MREIPKYTLLPPALKADKVKPGRALEAQANAAEYLYSPGDMGTKICESLVIQLGFNKAVYLVESMPKNSVTHHFYLMAL
jgi:hypothetical protein